jgi:hypothetical protein
VARKRWNEAGYSCVAVPINRPQIDARRGAAGRAANPKIEMPSSQRRSYGRGIQQRHLLGLALVPSHDKAFGVLAYLPLGRATLFRQGVGNGLALDLHSLPVEAHAVIVAEPDGMSIGADVGYNARGGLLPCERFVPTYRWEPPTSKPARIADRDEHESDLEADHCLACARPL